MWPLSSSVRHLFAYHEYGSHFESCLDLDPEPEDVEELVFDEWLPLEIEFLGDQVTVNYRVMFLGKNANCWSSSDRQLVGSRESNRLVFQRRAGMPNISLKRTNQSLRD